MINIAIIGAGSFGTSLAVSFCKNINDEVLLWARDKDLVSSINQDHINMRYFPEIVLPIQIKGSLDLKDLSIADIIFVTVGSNALSDILNQIKHCISIDNKSIIICAKGIDRTGKFFNEILAQIFDVSCNAFIMSGPSFSSEIISGKQTSVDLAKIILSTDHRHDETINLCNILSCANINISFIPSTNPKEMQILSVMKNICAIGMGFLHEAGEGLNRCALFFTKFITDDIQNVLQSPSLGNLNDRALLSVSGIGDLFLTSTSEKSRNYCFGKLLYSRVRNLDISNNSTQYSERRHETDHIGNLDKVISYLEKSKEIKIPEGIYGLRNLFYLCHNIALDLNERPKLECCFFVYDIIMNWFEGSPL